MQWLDKFLLQLAPNLTWRRVCPHTVEGIAQDFLNQLCLPIESLNLDASFPVHDGDPWFAWKRRISAIYGISKRYADPHRRPQERGWNKRLWQQYVSHAPDELVEFVFDSTIQLLRSRIEQKNSEMQ